MPSHPCYACGTSTIETMAPYDIETKGSIPGRFIGVIPCLECSSSSCKQATFASIDISAFEFSVVLHLLQRPTLTGVPFNLVRRMIGIPRHRQEEQLGLNHSQIVAWIQGDHPTPKPIVETIQILAERYGITNELYDRLVSIQYQAPTKRTYTELTMGQGPFKEEAIDKPCYEEIVSNADCETTTWWEAAKIVPLAAMQSPLYSLLLLEEPERWLKLEEEYAEKWTITHLRQRNEIGSRFIFDCLQRSLPLFAEDSPDDTRFGNLLSSMEPHLLNREELRSFDRVVVDSRLPTITNSLYRALHLLLWQDNRAHNLVNALYSIENAYAQHAIRLEFHTERRRYKQQECLWRWRHFAALANAQIKSDANLT